MSSRAEQVILLFLAFLVLSGAGFRLWMREGDIIIEVVETESGPVAVSTHHTSLSVQEQTESPSPAPQDATPNPAVTRRARSSSEESESKDPVGQSSPSKINVNTASIQELDSLPGIGLTLAQRIVDDRKQFGPYESVDELKRVKGIGTETVERLRPFVVVE